MKSWLQCLRWVQTSGQRREEGGSDVGGLRDTQGTLGTARRRALASSEEVSTFLFCVMHYAILMDVQVVF